MSSPTRPYGQDAREVDVARIERELVALLRRPEYQSTSGEPGVRTAVLNLVAYAPDRPTLGRITETLGALADHHPSRTIVVLIDPRAPLADIDAWVQVQCKRVGSNDLSVCAEQIVLEAAPSAARRIPNAVLPLLRADLPVVLWWPGEPPLREPFLHDLLEPAYRFVVDTSDGTHLERYLTQLNGLRRRPGLAVDLVDLNWERLLPWRELIAQFWDVAAWRSQLRGLDRVEIDLGRPAGGRSNRSQGLLVAGWIGSRLGWTPQRIQRRADGYTLTARRPGGSVAFEIRIAPDPLGGLRGVRFFVDTERHRSSWEVRASGDGCADVVVRRDGAVVGVPRVAPLESYREAELLGRALDTLRGEAVFEGALDTVATWLALDAPPQPARK
jgi:glucose-6-phosphate dehydrogenase assembly protein OpcA